MTIPSMLSYDSRRGAVALVVWEKWTNNGADINESQGGMFYRWCLDAAHNSYEDAIDTLTWIRRTLAYLNLNTDL